MVGTPPGHRDLAVKVVLQRIDRKDGGYPDKESQGRLLEQLIAQHGLKTRTQGSRGRPARDSEMTVKEYRDVLSKAICNHGSRVGGSKPTLLRLFTKGSNVLSAEYRKKLRDISEPAIASDEDDAANTSTRQARGQQQEQEPVEEKGENVNDPLTASAQIEKPIDAMEQPSPDGSRAQTPVAEAGEPRGKKRKPETETLEASLDANLTTRSVEEDSGLSVPTLGTDDNDSTHLKDTAPEHQGNGPAEKKRRQTHGIRELVKLSDDTITKRVSSILYEVQSCTEALLEALAVNGEHSVPIVQNPVPELESLYNRIFGANWLTRARKLTSAGMVTARGVLKACIAAAVHELVLSPQLPWDTAKDKLEGLGPHVVEEFDRIFRAIDYKVGFQPILWKAVYNVFGDSGFKNEYMLPHAQKLADKFLLSMDEQLESYIRPKTKRKLPLRWEEQAAEALKKIFLDALILKSQLVAAPEFYDTEWAISGSRFVGSKMEALNPSEGLQEVVWGLTSVVSRRQSPDEGWVVVCPARVLTRPQDVT